MRGLERKVVVVAGGGSGIGTATAERLSAEGAHVVVGDLNAESAAATAEAIDGRGFGFDISDDRSCRELIEFAVAEYGGIDGLFCVAADMSAGTLGRDADVVEVPLDVWKRTLDVNLTGTFLMARHAIPVLLSRGGGSIVNTLTGLIFRGDADRAAYNASKGGVWALTNHIATRWGKEGIRCNAIAPGLVLTEQVERNVSPEEREAILASNRSTRLGRPADIAASVAFLLSDDAEWINGQVHLVNGGR
jgi:NAD(P)-dependent dehydrogenase (short-subunit alcohol dehydrogenase family)